MIGGNLAFGMGNGEQSASILGHFVGNSVGNDEEEILWEML